MAQVQVNTGLLENALLGGAMDAATARFARELCIRFGIPEYDDELRKTTEHMLYELYAYAEIGRECAKMGMSEISEEELSRLIDIITDKGGSYNER